MPSVQRIANSLLTCTALLAATVAAFEEHDHEKRNMIGKRDLSDQRYYTLAIIHATVGAIATMVVFPLGVVGARSLRLRTRLWWIPHAALQGLIGGGLIIAAFTISIILVGEGQSFTPGHRRSGLVLFILIVVQASIGTALKAFSRTATHRKSPRVAGRPFQNLIHVLLGLAIVGLGFYQVYSGFDLFHKETMVAVPLVVYIMWGALVGAFVVTYVLSLAWLPAQFRKEASRRDNSQKSYTSSSTPNGETGTLPNSTNGTVVDDSAIDSRRTSVAPLVEGGYQNGYGARG